MRTKRNEWYEQYINVSWLPNGLRAMRRFEAVVELPAVFRLPRVDGY